MDASGKMELGSIIIELNSIITSLESYQGGIKNGFIGIGHDTCASRLDSILSSLRRAHKSLSNIDTTITANNNSNANVKVHQ